MPATQAPPAQGGGGGKFAFLKKKLGPQPTWAWMAELLGLALAYSLYKDRKASSSSSTSSTAAAASNGATPADQVPDVIIQNGLSGRQWSGPSTTGSTTGTSTTGTTGSTVPPSVPPSTPPTTTRPTSYTAPGTDTGDINQIAKQFGLTEQQLIAANPNLKKLKVKVGNKSVNLIGSGAPVPKGTVLKIPAA